jgi:RNA polymerase sigma-70 factor (ECF subfamily)
MQNTEQYRLISLAKNGDEYAISCLFDIHCQGIFRFLYYRTCDRFIAEDLTSEVFIQMIRSLHKYNPDSGSFTSWLYTIARKTKSRPEQAIIEDLISSSPGPEATNDKAQLQDDLISKIKELPKEYRELIALRFVSQLSIHETAIMLGKTIDSVKGMQYRALEVLREKMKLWKE